MTNEILFYTGIAVAICSILMAIVYFLISKVKMVQLDAKLDEEYGKEADLTNRKLRTAK